MSDINNILTYLNSSVRNLILDAIKISIRKPAQLKFFRAFLKNQNKAQIIREQYEGKGQHIPPFLIASITSNCNLFCTGCYARANNSCGCKQEKPQLSAEKWSSIFSEARELGVCFILLAGGEPLLRNHVILTATKYPEIVFPVFTNGTLIDDRYINLFDKNRNIIPILSIEGDKTITDMRRGDGVYDKIFETMKKLKDKNIMFGASITVTKNNVFSVTEDSFIKKLKKNGCSIIFYVEYVPVDNVSRDIAPTEIEREILKERAESLKAKNNILIISFPGDEDMTDGCLAAGRGFVHINNDGGVEPCPFSPYSDVSLSDISLKEALDSSFLKKVRDNHFLLGEHIGGCLLFEKQTEVEKILTNCKIS